MSPSATPAKTPQTSSRASAMASPTTKSSPTSPLHQKSFHASLVAALKLPFQGWSKDLLAAKDDLDDDYNFPRGGRRIEEEYNFPRVKRRGEEDYHYDSRSHGTATPNPRHHSHTE